MKISNFETDRLFLKRPTLDEQYDLWNILKNEDINKYYIITPSRFKNRDEFQESLNNWEKQKVFFEGKVNNLDTDQNMYTWSIFLKNGTVIGQITVQPNNNYPDNSKIRDIGWFIDKKYQRKGYMYEAASCIIKYMLEDMGIDRIETGAALINEASWKLMEKLGFIRVGIVDSPYFNEDGTVLPGYKYILEKGSK